jgi:hypothetical protein
MLYLLFERNKRMDMNNSLVGFMFLFHKSPGWNHRISYEKTLFGRKYFVWNWNIWNLYTFIKVPVWIIGKHMKRHFSAENISFEIGIFNYKSPGWNHRKTFEKTLFGRKYFVWNWDISYSCSSASAPPSTHSVHTPIFGHWWKCCHLRNMYATCPINVQNGGWPKYFWNTKNMRFVTDQSQLFWFGWKNCDCNFLGF